MSRRRALFHGYYGCWELRLLIYGTFNFDLIAGSPISDFGAVQSRVVHGVMERRAYFSAGSALAAATLVTRHSSQHHDC